MSELYNFGSFSFFRSISGFGLKRVVNLLSSIILGSVQASCHIWVRISKGRRVNGWNVVAALAGRSVERMRRYMSVESHRRSMPISSANHWSSYFFLKTLTASSSSVVVWGNRNPSVECVDIRSGAGNPDTRGQRGSGVREVICCED